ncbi:hypothetical protein NDU88_004653 [Pleurodeles waltl]|uniref:Uncharacterized protein n=1 Tax=Pleurodeles waltl TaxID=8319 RepID=A0AAV7QFG2_PLEWA|nr:hypothetical protein NDU88_004653 [Pleurodeles waltl]
MGRNSRLGDRSSCRPSDQDLDLGKCRKMLRNLRVTMPKQAVPACAFLPVMPATSAWPGKGSGASVPGGESVPTEAFRTASEAPALRPGTAVRRSPKSQAKDHCRASLGLLPNTWQRCTGRRPHVVRSRSHSGLPT